MTARHGSDDQTADALFAGVSPAALLRELADGAAVEDLLRRHPGLRLEHVRACFALAARVLEPTPANDTAAPTPADAEGVTLAGPPELAAPRRVSIPGYEILGELGRGGMGVVYKARQVRLNRVVALKMVLAGEHASAETLARFQREAEAVAQLAHPNIVQIYEVGEHDGHSYLALEYVPGGSLAAQLTDEPWRPEDAAALVEQIARAIHFAHERGVVHRDLKPENVLLQRKSQISHPKSQTNLKSQISTPTRTDTPGGEVEGCELGFVCDLEFEVWDLEPKVTDFGLAKRLEEQGQTRTGEVMGTPAYMAPEQAAGKKDVGPAADVHALGAILHRLLSGRPPFEGPTTLDVLLQVMENEPPPLRQLNPKVPRDLETIVLKCLAKEPGKRYETAQKLANDLRRFLDGDPIKARRVGPVERAWRWAKKNPILATLRAMTGLFVVYMSIFPIFMGGAATLATPIVTGLGLLALLRGRGRPLLVGTLLAIPLALVALVAAGVYLHDRSAEVERAFTGDGDGSLLPLGLFLLAGTLPLWVGLFTGAVFRESWRVLFAGLALLALAAWLSAPSFLALPITLVVVFLVGLLVRFVHARWGGNRVDILCGILPGALVASCFGSVLGGILMAVVAGPSGPTSVGVKLWIALGALYGCAFLGMLVGAVLGAIVAARYTREPPPRTAQ